MDMEIISTEQPDFKPLGVFLGLELSWDSCVTIESCKTYALVIWFELVFQYVTPCVIMLFSPYECSETTNCRKLKLRMQLEFGRRMQTGVCY